jgi:plasmid stability protein
LSGQALRESSPPIRVGFAETRDAAARATSGQAALLVGASSADALWAVAVALGVGLLFTAPVAPPSTDCQSARPRILRAMKAKICKRQMIMSQLTVRHVSAEIVRSLKRRSAAHGRSAEAEHREILREALREGAGDFEARAKILRERLRSRVDATEIIRADRDREGE